MISVSKEEAGTKEINRFINHYEDENVATKYDAGIVCMKNGNYMVGYEMKGAEETFSVGQPVYDEDKNLMGYLGICMYDNLNYSTHGNVRIPVEYWMICLPTKYCVEGKKIYTYWQINQKGSAEERSQGEWGEWIRLDLAKRVIAKFKGYLDEDMIERIQIALAKESEADHEQTT